MNCIDIDGNPYKTVKIGEQIWMAENLMVTRYRNGDSIPNFKNNQEWGIASSGGQSTLFNDPDYLIVYYKFPDENKREKIVYGRYYNWYAVNDSRLLAPKGWHIPTDEEFKELEMYLGMSEVTANRYDQGEGGPEEERGNWKGWHVNGGRGTIEGSMLAGHKDFWGFEGCAIGRVDEFGMSGFNAAPAGWRSIEDGFIMEFNDPVNPSSVSSWACFWTSTEFETGKRAWNRKLVYVGQQVIRDYDDIRNGYSIRCIKN